MDQEIRELNRMVCKNCDEREYENCKVCRVYKLVNTIAEQKLA